MKHDAWMSECFWHTFRLELSSLCNGCACENVACGRCVCLHTPSVARGIQFPASEKASLDLNNHFCSVQDEDRQEFQLLLQSSCCPH